MQNLISMRQGQSHHSPLVFRLEAGDVPFDVVEIVYSNCVFLSVLQKGRIGTLVRA